MGLFSLKKWNDVWCLFVVYIRLRLRFVVRINFRIILMFKVISIDIFFLVEENIKIK